MGCSHKIKVKPVSIERCNEMITGFENQINRNFDNNVKHKGKKRKELIKRIQDNPTHCWVVTAEGIISFGL